MEQYYLQMLIGGAVAVIGYFLRGTIEDAKQNGIQIMNLKQTNAELTLKIAEIKENVLQKQEHLEEMTKLQLENIFRELKEIKTDLRSIKKDKD